MYINKHGWKYYFPELVCPECSSTNFRKGDLVDRYFQEISNDQVQRRTEFTTTCNNCGCKFLEKEHIVFDLKRIPLSV